MDSHNKTIDLAKVLSPGFWQDDAGQPIEYTAKQSKLFWDSQSFEEYAVKCDIEGLTRLFDKESFDSMHGFLDLAIERTAQNMANTSYTLCNGQLVNKPNCH